MTRPFERMESPFAARVETAKPAVLPPRAVGRVRPDPTLPLRSMTGHEEALLEIHGTNPNVVWVCNELLARCLVPPGADVGPARQRVRALLVAERDRALVQLRRLSLGPNVESGSQCPHCGTANDLAFSLDDLPVQFEVPLGPVSCTLADDTRVELRLPNAGDQEDLLEARIEGAAERRTWMLSRVLLRYGTAEGEAPGGGFSPEFARSLPTATRRQMEAAIRAVLPDFDLHVPLTCSACGNAFSGAFDVVDFFFGELKGRRRNLFREIHRLARAYHWGEAEILSLSLPRRLKYLLLLEEEEDASLLAGIREAEAPW